MSEEKLFCLTLDLENDWYFDEPGYDHLTLEYLDDFIELIQGVDVPLSVFVVGKTLEKYPEVVDRLADDLDSEFHLHSYQHDTSKSYDFREEIRRGKAAFREHFGEDPIGYRAPQGNIEPEEFEVLESEGFEFDSSIFPSYRPGVYNNLRAPLEPYVPEGVSELLEIPIGTTPKIRIPTSHSYLKLLGRPYISYLKANSLPEVLVYNVHLQDLYRTKSYEKLSPIKRAIFSRNIDNAEDILTEVVDHVRARGYETSTMNEVMNRKARVEFDRLEV